MTTTTPTRGFTLTRHLAAPRELVFDAWTDPDQLHWFAGAPPDANEPAVVDLRIGGAWQVRLVESEDRSYLCGGIYREIVRPERLVFTWGAVGGWPAIDPERPEDTPVVTVTFNDLGDATEMIFELELSDHLSADEVRAWFDLGIQQGWSATIDRLPIHLSSVVTS